MSAANPIQLYFDDSRSPIICHSVAELDEALDRLHLRSLDKSPPLAVSIIIHGFEIDSGIGSDLTFVCIQVEPRDGEYYCAVGVDDSVVWEPKMFYGAGQDSYWDSKNLIPIAQARDAIRHFVSFQERLPSIRWQDWKGDDV